MFIGITQYKNRIPDDIRIKVDDDYINPSKQVKNLGLYMDRHIAYNSHIEMCATITGILMYMACI